VHADLTAGGMGLADTVNNANEGHPNDWYAYHGYHWRTVLAILTEFQSKGYLTVHLTNQGPYLSHVTSLARRAPRGAVATLVNLHLQILAY
jgi:hypothetical protein